MCLLCVGIGGVSAWPFSPHTLALQKDTKDGDEEQTLMPTTTLNLKFKKEGITKGLCLLGVLACWCAGVEW